MPSAENPPQSNKAKTADDYRAEADEILNRLRDVLKERPEADVPSQCVSAITWWKEIISMRLRSNYRMDRFHREHSIGPNLRVMLLFEIGPGQESCSWRGNFFIYPIDFYTTLRSCPSPHLFSTFLCFLFLKPKVIVTLGTNYNNFFPKLLFYFFSQQDHNHRRNIVYLYETKFIVRSRTLHQYFVF